MMTRMMIFIIFQFLLFGIALTNSCRKYVPNMIVDAKGGGNFSSIQAAVDFAPNNSPRKFVILIRKGNYHEKITINQSKTNLVILGEGASVTHILWNDSVQNTQDPATVKMLASDFIASDISFHNTFVPAPHLKCQALAAVVLAERVAFYRCSFYGFQDTLLDDRGLHYYQDCFIQGSVDFIFGNGQSYYLNCIINSVSKEWPGLPGFITAQSRGKANETSGYSFVNCSIQGNGQVALGRPWASHARVVFSNTKMSTVVTPAGWVEWDGKSSQGNVLFGEFNNTGPGASTAKRVGWSKQLTYLEAQPFLTLDFINASDWLPDSPCPAL